MTPEDIAAVEAAAHECDPDATVSWDRSHETLTIECTPECTGPMIDAVRALGQRVVIVIKFRSQK